MHYLLTYEYSADYLQRRDEFRAEHLKLAWDAVQRGELLLAGAVGEPIDRALLVFTIDSPEAAEAFVRDDPYVQNGLVTTWKVQKWHTVVGDLASTPVH